MANEIDINVVIEQLIGRIAQLEFEVAVLKAEKLSASAALVEPNPGVEEKTNDGYM